MLDDSDQVTADEFARGFDHITQVKKFHTQAKKGIDDAQRHALAMNTEARDALDQLAELLT